MTTTALRLAAVIAMTAGLAGAKGPTQPDMVASLPETPRASGCVFITQIESHSGGFFKTRLDAIVSNRCAGTADVTLTLGYFSGSGEQYGNGSESMTLAAGAERHLMTLAPSDGRWRETRIIRAVAYVQ